MTNYTIGRTFEYKIINLLKKYLPSNKYTIIRTAGSHSPVDVFVIEHRNGENAAFGIQCKSEKKKTKNVKNKYIKSKPL